MSNTKQWNIDNYSCLPHPLEKILDPCMKSTYIQVMNIYSVAINFDDLRPIGV